MSIKPIKKQLLSLIFLLLIYLSMPLGAADSGTQNVTVPPEALEYSARFRIAFNTTPPHSLPNKALTWSLSPNNGSATLSGSSTTDDDAYAAFTLAFHANACGTYTVTMRTVQDPRPGSNIKFVISGKPSCPTAPSPTLEKISDDNQFTAPGDSVTFTVELQDSDGSPTSDVEVTFSILSGDESSASLNPVKATTDANGRAMTTLTLGTDATGKYIVKANRSDRSDIYTEFNVTVDPLLPKATRLKIISGNEQQGLPGAALEKSFVVEVRDQFDKPLQGAQVTFSVTSGGGTLSASSAVTGADGRAESILMLGPNPGTNTVSAAVTGVQGGQTFTAEGVRIPKSLEMISGDEQQGLPGAALEKSFVVEVRDQSGKSLQGVEVTFSVASGGGTLSATSAVTGADGRAESILTLGPNPGTNTVTAAVTGVQGGQTFTAEGVRIPKSLKIISGDEQQGLPGTTLENLFVVEVRDQFDKPLQGAEVTFSVKNGGGTLSATIAATDSDGRAESRLTLGQNPGTNTVSAAVTGVREGQTFTAEGVRIPKSLKIISGDNQQGPPGRTLENPFVVEVQDQFDKHLQGVQVKFSATNGGGTLSATSVTTNARGRAESILTLGPNPGTNTVAVDVTGVQGRKAFTAEGVRTPLAFWIVFGDKQQGVVGTALANPFIVDVRDHSGEPLPGVPVMFSVTAGDGTLSVTNEVTGSNGRVESILTLGPNPGINTVTVSVTGIVGEQSASATADPPPIPEDVNGDDVVDILDLVSVASDLGNEGKNLVSDVNGDEVVNILDLVLVARAFGTAAAPANPHAPAMLTAADVERWLAQAQTLDLTDATTQMGVLVLEQLAAALMPEETALLPNYPNPFNPETWIPYQLSEDCPVSVSIYDRAGALVRTLSLGMQFAGFYNSRSRAAYWDGRNGRGEPVASGLYFYTLTAGKFAATRKMFIRK